MSANLRGRLDQSGASTETFSCDSGMCPSSDWTGGVIDIDALTGAWRQGPVLGHMDIQESGHRAKLMGRSVWTPSTFVGRQPPSRRFLRLGWDWVPGVGVLANRCSFKGATTSDDKHGGDHQASGTADLDLRVGSPTAECERRHTYAERGGESSPRVCAHAFRNRRNHCRGRSLHGRYGGHGSPTSVRCSSRISKPQRKRERARLRIRRSTVRYHRDVGCGRVHRSKRNPTVCGSPAFRSGLC